MIAPASLNYGSDQSGLIWGFVFGRDERATLINSADALAWLKNHEKQSAHETQDSRVFWAIPCWDEWCDDLHEAAGSGLMREGDSQ